MIVDIAQHCVPVVKTVTHNVCEANWFINGFWLLTGMFTCWVLGLIKQAIMPTVVKLETAITPVTVKTVA